MSNEVENNVVENIEEVVEATSAGNSKAVFIGVAGTIVTVAGVVVLVRRNKDKIRDFASKVKSKLTRKKSEPEVVVIDENDEMMKPFYPDELKIDENNIFDTDTQ